MSETPGTQERPGADEPGLQVGIGAAGEPRRAAAASSRLPNWAIPVGILALVVVGGLGLGLGMLIAGNDDAAAPSTTAPDLSTTAAFDPADAYGAAVTVEGEPLSMLEDPAADDAVGREMPSLTGTDYAGNAIAIVADGRPKLILGLAHWCPYCNEEVPILNDWYAAGIPEGIDVVVLSVYADPSRANFPPATWVADAGFAVPVMADDQARTIVRTLGIPAVPFWLGVLPDGTVAFRTTGQRDAATLDQIVSLLLSAG